MAAENTTAKKNFYVLREGKFRQSVQESEKTEKTKSQEHDGKTYFYNEYNRVRGFFRRSFAFVQESKAGKEWEMYAIDLRDSDNALECLQMSFDSNATTSFLKRLKNCDLTKELIIVVRQDDKSYDRLDVYQTDENGNEKIVPFFWNKENPLPKWKEVKKATATKKAVWDKSEQEEILKALINEKNAAAADIYAQQQNKPKDAVADVLNQEREAVQQQAQADDLPF